MRYMNLRPSQVVLDPENPRLPDGTSSDREAINRLLNEGSDALINLARDMARTGQANPAELPIAVKENTRYLILEGNRRFAALKLLSDPALADEEVHQKSFRRAASLGSPPRRVYTVIAPSREDADHWIFLRHTGENEGIGTRRWNASQTATHRKRANKTVDSGTLRSITIADELEETYAADTELIDLVRQVRRDKITNIGRFFSKDVMTRLSFELRADGNSSLRTHALLVRHTAEELRDFFAWAIAYIANNSVDAYKNSNARQHALQEAKYLLPNPASASDEPFQLAKDRRGISLGDSDSKTASPDSAEKPNTDSSNGSSPYGDISSSVNNGSSAANENFSSREGADSSTPASDSSRGKNEAKLERYLLSGLRLPRHPQRIQQLLQEGRKLALEESPGVACVVLRIIVELSVSSPETLALSGQREGEPLKKKILATLRYLDPNIEHPARRDKDLEQAFLETEYLGMQYLNGFVHNSSVRPDHHLARRFSTAFRPFLKRVDGAL